MPMLFTSYQRPAIVSLASASVRLTAINTSIASGDESLVLVPTRREPQFKTYTRPFGCWDLQRDTTEVAIHVLRGATTAGNIIVEAKCRPSRDELKSGSCRVLDVMLRFEG